MPSSSTPNSSSRVLLIVQWKQRVACALLNQAGADINSRERVLFVLPGSSEAQFQKQDVELLG